VKIKVKVPGSCGELVQGVKEGKSFHITCPINLFSYINIGLNHLSGKIKCPSFKTKSLKAAEETLKFFKEEGSGIKIEIFSQIPIGKGMASSTADIVGVCSSLSALLKKKITASDIARIALRIEPTDGTLFKGVVVFDHLKGELLQNLGEPPQMKILVVDMGGRIDTLHFHKKMELKNRDYSKNESETLESLRLVKKGIEEQNINLIGEGATLSALSNQKILFKPKLNFVISLSKKMGAVGVNVAHSGTVVGVLLPPDFCQEDKLKNSLQNLLQKKLRFYETYLISGGWTFL